MRAGASELERAPPLGLHIAVPAAALLVDLALAAANPGTQTVWYVIRASGIVAYVLLALTVAAGISISAKALPAGRARVDAYEVHSFAALLVLGFSGIHGIGLLLDKFIGFNAVQVLVPFTSTYRPLAVALGIMGLYLMAVVYGSFWARKYIGYQGWHRLHYVSFVAFWLAAAHSILSGTDSGKVWMLAIYIPTLLGILGLLAYRIANAQPALAAPRPS